MGPSCHAIHKTLIIIYNKDNANYLRTPELYVSIILIKHKTDNLPVMINIYMMINHKFALLNYQFFDMNNRLFK